MLFKIAQPFGNLLMADRPTELDLMLDAIDETFKSAIGQFAKNAAIALEQIPAQQGVQIGKIEDSIALVRRARRLMITMVAECARAGP